MRSRFVMVLELALLFGLVAYEVWRQLGGS